MIRKTITVGLGLALAFSSTATIAGAAAGDEVLCAKVKSSTGELKGSVKIRRLSDGGCKFPKEEQIGTVAGLTAVSACRDYKASVVASTNTYTIPNNTSYFLTFDTEQYDTAGMWPGPGPDTTKVCVPSDGAGKYLVTASVDFGFQGNGSDPQVGVREIYISGGGQSYGQVQADPPDGGTSDTITATASIVDLDGDECVRLFAFQGSGETIDISGELMMQKLCP